MTEPDQTLTFACPHCAGPLHLVETGDVECKRGHRFTVSDVLLEQARTSAQAAWLAVNALRDRAKTSRWAANDPDLYGLGDADQLERSATEDEKTADLLRHQAQALDLTVWRLDQMKGEDEQPPT